jgi:hypothetical protein
MWFARVILLLVPLLLGACAAHFDGACCSKRESRIASARSP